MKVIIAGSRFIIDPNRVIEAIQKSSFDISEVVCGMARGVDTIGLEWAKNNNIPVKEFPADWDKFGKSAGYRRNLDMGNYADCLIAIWDTKSKGTGHMINIMQQLKKPIFVLEITT